MPDDSPADSAAIEVRGYVTDAKRVGYQVLTNYESIYWRALVGNGAWSLYEVLRSFCHHGNNTCNPSVQFLTTILGLEDKRALIGRTKTVNGKEYRYPGLIEVLQEHKLAVAEVKGEAPKTWYIFHVNLTPDLLTPEQLAQLPAILQKKHAELLKRCTQEQRKLEAKRKPSRFEKSNKNSGDDDPTGGGNFPPPVGISHGGGGKFPPKQQPITIPTKTITETRASDNNNSGAEDGEKHAVVVAFLTAQGLAEKVAQRLASRYGRERILEKIEFLDYLREAAPEQIKNPRGWLRRAIEENYGAPDGYQSAAERAAAAAAQEREYAAQQAAYEAECRRAEAERESRQQAAAAGRAQLQATYGTTQRDFDLWQQILAEFKNTMPEATFQMNVADMVLLSLQDEQALIGLPNKQARAWVENRLTLKIQRTLASMLGGRKITVTFVDLAADDGLREPAVAGSGHRRDGV